MDRQAGTDRGRPLVGATFTAALIGEPVLGQLYFVQEGATICAMSFVALQSVAGGYDTIIADVVDSVRAVTP